MGVGDSWASGFMLVSYGTAAATAIGLAAVGDSYYGNIPSPKL